MISTSHNSSSVASLPLHLLWHVNDYCCLHSSSVPPLPILLILTSKWFPLHPLPFPLCISWHLCDLHFLQSLFNFFSYTPVIRTSKFHFPCSLFNFYYNNISFSFSIPSLNFYYNNISSSYSIPSSIFNIIKSPSLILSPLQFLL